MNKTVNPIDSVGIAHTAYVLATHQMNVQTWCEEQQWPQEQAEALRANGADCFHRVFNSQGQSEHTQIELGLRAVNKLLAECPQLAAQDIDALVVCHTSPCNALPMPYTLSGILREQAGLSRALAWSIAHQQCVSPIHALRVLRAMFGKHTHWRNALIVCVDTVLREDLRAIGTAGIHSDGASAMWVQRGAKARITSLQTFNDPVAVHGILPDGRYEPNDNYLWTLISVIRRVIKDAGLKPLDVSTVLPHNVNLSAWHQAMDALRLPHERLFARNFGRIGHVFGSDAAVNVADAAVLDQAGHHLVFASGIGGCFGGFMLSKEGV